MSPRSARALPGARPAPRPALGGPLGAHVESGGTRFAALSSAAKTCFVRLWAPGQSAPSTHELEPVGDGRFEGRVEGAGHDALYRFVLDGRELGDPYARFLPEGVHGRAQVVEPRHAWRHPCVARPLREHVIYELHVGTFSAGGTYTEACEQLPALVELGATAIELMPVAAFAGSRGWGYDGVAHYAPFAPYGSPDELRRLVDEAHGFGLAVLLDVVYNHFGPAGNVLPQFCPEYLTRELSTPWGHAPDFGYPPMRRYALDNALYWLSEFRFDGLRIDACHALCDRSEQTILRELADEVGKLEPARLLLAEDASNDPSLILRTGLDAIWADDFHHALRVALTGERDGYYAGYERGARTVASAIERGWLYEGQPWPPSGVPRGASARGLSAERFVYCIQNHDQIGNRALGERLSRSVSLEAYCAASALLLFLPMTPLLFMGQEWAASTPFLYFTDHEPELGARITECRRQEFHSFDDFGDPVARERIPDPQSLESFERSRLRWDERADPEHARVLALYRALLALRRSDPVLREAGRDQLSAEARGDVLIVRNQLGAQVRALLVNLGDAAANAADLGLGAGPWRVLLASDGVARVPPILTRHGFALLAAGSGEL